MTADFYGSKRVALTGGAGFVGSHVVDQLVARGAEVVVLARPGHDSVPPNLVHVAGHIEILPVDLTDVPTVARALQGADVAMHLAASIGGVQFSSVHQASIFRANLDPFMSVIEAARLADVGRFLVCSTACVYPADAVHPTPESEGFKGFPQVTNEGYGMSKRMQEYLGMKYVEEFGMDVRIARPFNGYGPRDDFDEATSHVIPALIKKVLRAKDAIDVWGDGSATRAFLYVDDFARGLLSVAERGPVAQAVNLGPDEEISIRQLIELVMKVSGKRLGIRWDTSKPAGQQVRGCDTTFARSSIGFSAQVPFEVGLRKTMDWFREGVASGAYHL